jgi:hypothetical protein
MGTAATLVDTDGSLGSPSPTQDPMDEPAEGEAAEGEAASATASATSTSTAEASASATEGPGETQVQTQGPQEEEEAVPAKLTLHADGSLKPAAKQMGIGKFFASSGSATTGVSMPAPVAPVPKKGSLLAAFQKQAAAQAIAATAEGKSPPSFPTSQTPLSSSA